MRQILLRPVRRLLYTGRRRPEVLRPHAAWPPPVDPWLHGAETQILPPYPLYEKRTER